MPLLFRARGTTRESLIEGAKQKHTQREGLYDLRRLELGLEESVKSQYLLWFLKGAKRKVRHPTTDETCKVFLDHDSIVVPWLPRTRETRYVPFLGLTSHNVEKSVLFHSTVVKYNSYF